MKILFIQDNGMNESVALAELSSLLKLNGHDCDLLLEREEKIIINKVKKINPGLIIFPFGILGQQYALRLSKKIKNELLNAPIVFAGSHPTFYPDIIEHPYVDIICRGEAEYPILELIEKMEKHKPIKKIRGLWIKEKNKIYKNELSAIVKDLGEIPMPDREIYYKRYKFLKKNTMKKFSSGRGCPNSCSFCFNGCLRNEYNTKKYTRKKPVKKLINEIKHTKENYPLKHVHFSDDLFCYDKKWVKEFSKEYKKEINLPFTYNSTADLINNDIINWTSLANCIGVGIGIETGNEQLRIKLLNKKITDNQIIQAGKKIKNAGLKLATFNIIANPGETINDALLTMKLNQKVNVDVPRVTISFPIKNTQLYHYAIENGYLNEKDLESVENRNFAQANTLYRSEYMKEFENLLYLFRIGCKYPKLNNVIEKLIKFPNSHIFKFLTLYSPIQEKEFFNIPIKEGLMFFYHCGNPMARTTNYSSIV